MDVKSWFSDFSEKHTFRFRRTDWPEDETEEQRASALEFWNGWKQAFIRNGLTKEVADEASLRLVEEPPAFLDDHLPALLAMAKKIFQERPNAAPLSTRESVKIASLGCDDCCGQGLTYRYRIDQKPFVFYCRCPMGRWMERTHREQSPEVRKRIYDLEEHAFLWGRERRVPRAVIEQLEEFQPILIDAPAF